MQLRLALGKLHAATPDLFNHGFAQSGEQKKSTKTGRLLYEPEKV